MVRYKRMDEDNDLVEEDIELCETRSLARPKPAQGYRITRALVRDPAHPKRLVKGYKKTAIVKKHKVGGMTTAQRKIAARKAVRTKRANPTGQRRAIKKQKITRKKSKQAGLSK